MSQYQQPNNSPMSITQLVNSSEEDDHNRTVINDIEDPDVKIAAEALGDMARLSTVKAKPVITLPPLSTPSTTPSSPLPTPTSSSFSASMSNDTTRFSFSSESTMDEDMLQQQKNSSNHFIHRVSNIPLVNSALKAYESSKNSSSVVKYGAEMVESIAAPIYGKFGKHAASSLSGVDEWGCKQLDKLEERYPGYTTKNGEEEMTAIEEEDDDASSTTFALSRVILDDHPNTTGAMHPQHESGLRKRRDSHDETNSYPVKNRSRNCSRSTSPHRPYSITKPTAPTQRAHHRTQQSAPLVRSKWHQIVMHASSAAGTTAAVISEESMKCLRYCLSWLQYASQHIDQQMNLLRKFLVSLAHHRASTIPITSSKDASKPTSKTVVTTHDNEESTLAQIKKEIVDTLRKVVDVISKYAGTGLPEQAKLAVRGFILALPTRWAILNSSTTASPAPNAAGAPGSAADAHLHETSIKLLNFGGESVEMIQSVAHVFSDTIERAELWINRLKVVGVAGSRSTTGVHHQHASSPVATASTSVKEEPEQMDLN